MPVQRSGTAFSHRGGAFSHLALQRNRCAGLAGKASLTLLETEARRFRLIPPFLPSLPDG